jgi:flagellar hook-associated protein 2
LAISFSGIGSGNDWTSLISSLVSVERSPITALNTRKSNASRQSAVVADVIANLSALASKARGLEPSGSLYAVATTSSDETRIKATATGSGAQGSYAIKVSQLARGETRQSQTFATSGAGAAGAGSFDLAVGTGTKKTISWKATDSLADIATKINDANAGVSAAAIYDGSVYRLVLTGQSTGAAADIAVTAETGTSLGLNAGGAVVRDARDAILEVNGVTANKASNQITDVVAGVTLDLRSVTPDGAGETLISTTRDPSSLTARVKELVDAYNVVAKHLAGQMAFNGTKKGDETLFGDPMIASLQRSLGGLVASGYTHGSGKVSARMLGITLNSDGTLTLDSAKLTSAVAADPTAAADLFTGTGGLAKAIYPVADRHTAYGGPLLTRQSTLTARQTAWDKEIAKVDEKASRLETRLKQQFAKLDELMASFNTQSTFLSSINREY